MAKLVTTDPNTLAAVVTGLGGRVINGDVFGFDLPLESVREVVCEIERNGPRRPENLGERIKDHPTKLFNPQAVET